MHPNERRAFAYKGNRLWRQEIPYAAQGMLDGEKQDKVLSQRYQPDLGPLVMRPRGRSASELQDNMFLLPRLPIHAIVAGYLQSSWSFEFQASFIYFLYLAFLTPWAPRFTSLLCSGLHGAVSKSELMILQRWTLRLVMVPQSCLSQALSKLMCLFHFYSFNCG